MKLKFGNPLRNSGLQTMLASLVCILLGLLTGYIVLLIIEPSGAWKALLAIMKNYFYYPTEKKVLQYLGTTLVKTAPLVLCSLSVLFAYKAGLFNIGVAGQYVAGAGACLYTALALQQPWYVCMLVAILAGAAIGAISGALKALCNVNEVISCIMLNWIGLYCVNILLGNVKESTSPYTMDLRSTNASAIYPSLGLESLFNNNKAVTIAIPLAVVVAVVIWVILTKTKLGYELRATGCNREAARYAGMKQNRNLILTMAISGGLAGLGASMLYQTGLEQWSCGMSSLPAMGFNGIAAAFLGGLHPVGAVFSSYFIQHITAGGAYVDKLTYCAQVSDLIAAIIIYLCGFVLFMKHAMNSGLDRVAEKKARAAEKKEGGEA